MMGFMLINSALDCVLGFLFCVLLSKKRFRSPAPIIAVIAAGAICVDIFDVIASYSTFVITAGFFGCADSAQVVVRAAVTLIVFLAGNAVILKEKPAVIAAYSLAAAYSIIISEIIFGNLGAWITGNYYMRLTNYDSFSRFVIGNCTVVILALFYWFFRKKSEYISGNALWFFDWLLFDFALGSVIYQGMLHDISDPENFKRQNGEFTAFIIGLMILAASAAVALMFSKICAKSMRNKLNLISEKSRDDVREREMLLRENNLALGKFRHDIVDHLTDIRALIAADRIPEALEMLDETARQAEAASEFKGTGNSIVDAVILSKAALCRAENVDFEYVVEPLDNFRIDAVDVSSLLSNLLNNAIEAAVKTERRYVALNIFDHNAYHVIRVENSSAEVGAVEPGLVFETTKENPSAHGFGMKIISDIAEKYEGNFSGKYEDGKFIATVFIKREDLR